MTGWGGTPGPWKADGVQVQAGKFTLTHRWPGIAERAEMEANCKGIAALPQLVEALLEAREYFSDRDDAECDPSGPGYTGNEEMRQLVAIDAVLAAAGVKP